MLRAFDATGARGGALAANGALDGRRSVCALGRPRAAAANRANRRALSHRSLLSEGGGGRRKYRRPRAVLCDRRIREGLQTTVKQNTAQLDPRRQPRRRRRKSTDLS